MIKISLDEVFESARKDLQTIETDVKEWWDIRENKKNYSLSELCEGVENDEIPYKVLWYVNSYCNLTTGERKQICQTLDIDDYSFKNKTVSMSRAVTNSTDITLGEEIDDSKTVANSKYIRNSEKISHSKYITNSQNVYNSSLVDNSKYVLDSKNIYNGTFISKSTNISSSKYIVSSSNVSDAIFCIGCENFKNGIFCAFIKESSEKYYIFNKEVDKEIFERLQTVLIYKDLFYKIFFPSDKKPKERDIKAFEDYCASLPYYDKDLFDYLMKSVFKIWE